MKMDSSQDVRLAQGRKNEEGDFFAHLGSAEKGLGGGVHGTKSLPKKRVLALRENAGEGRKGSIENWGAMVWLGK